MNNLLGNVWILDWLWLILLMVILVSFVIVVLVLVPFKLWFKAFVSGTKISMFKLISLKLRKLNTSLIVNTYITAYKAGLFIDIDELETHLTAGGHIDLLVNSLIMAENFKVDLSIDTAKAIDLSNRNIVEAVKSNINPKTIETENISCVTLDGYEIKIRFKVCLKSNLQNMVGTLGEETIVSKISENAVSVVAGYKNFSEVMQNTEDISANLLAKNLDKGNGYKLISIEVSHVEVGRDFGAEARALQIEEKRLKANLEAEQEKNQIALEEQRMKVKVQEMNVEKVKAETDIPKAIAKSVSEGKMDIMDYYKMQNIIADTNMRKALTKSAGENSENNKKIYFTDDD